MQFDRGKITFIFLGILVLIAVGVVLKSAQSVILPLIIAWLMSYLIGPAINFMTQRKIPTTLAVLIILILLLGVFYLSFTFLFARFSAFVAAYPKYHTRFTELIALISSQWNLEFDPLAGINWGQNIGRFLASASKSIFVFVSQLVLVIIFLFFILLGKPYFRYKILKSFSTANADQIASITFSITGQIRRYLSLQFLISFTTGVLVWLTLVIIGVDFAVTWGALAFFLNFVPTVGSIVASIPPILLALVQFYPSYWPGIITLISVMTIQLGMGNALAPKLMGDQLNLSPVVVLLSLLFWGWLWGIVGALLSIPIAATIKIVCENIETLHPISVMMGSGKTYRREFKD
ncbi:MAG: AI-2E family transporter [Desulfobacterales bacterium]|jgi:predicted PurR-regulated permease PerM